MILLNGLTSNSKSIFEKLSISDFFRSLIVYFVHIQNLCMDDHIYQFLVQVCVQKSKNHDFCL